MRIDKLLAMTGFGTRTEVKKLLKSKAVKVDGHLIKEAKTHVNPEVQCIMVYDEEVSYREYVYLMMNKPQDCLSATTDRQYRTVIDLLDDKYKCYEIVPAGRLDRDTEGLMLLTNDGQLVHEIISPKKAVFKRYLAHITGELTDVAIEKLEAGVEIFDGNDTLFKTMPARVCRLKTSDEFTAVEIEITEGKFHQVKRMFAHVGCKVVYLKRLAIGDLVLDDSLPLGAYRELEPMELEVLKKGR